MPLRRFFLNTRIFGPARLAFDDRHDPGVGHEGRAGEHFAAVFLDEQHLLERQFGAGSRRPCRRASRRRRASP